MSDNERPTPKQATTATCAVCFRPGAKWRVAGGQALCTACVSVRLRVRRGGTTTETTMLAGAPETR